MAKHDTPAIRRLARQLDSLSEQLSTTEKSASRDITNASNEMLGDTPKAINEAMTKLSSELKTIRGGLSRYASTLYQYANELDIADAKVQSMINSK